MSSDRCDEEQSGEKDKERSVWADRIFTLVVLFLGAFLGQGLQYWATFGYITSDVRAHLIHVNISGEEVEVALALINKGNQQGAIIGSHITVPISMGTPKKLAYYSVSNKESSVTGIPTVLSSRGVSLATVKNKLFIPGIIDGADPVSGHELDYFPNPETRKADVTLEVEALDFRGQKYKAYWSICTMFFSKNGVNGFRLKPESSELKIFSAANKQAPEYDQYTSMTTISPPTPPTQH